MDNHDETNDLLKKLQENPPKIIGGYKKQGWAVKTLEKTSNPDVEKEEDHLITAKAVLRANDETYYPAFLTLDMEKHGQIKGVYLISETEEEFTLIPFELALPHTGKGESDLLPLNYRTLVKIEGDQVQKNWPEFS
ncbi:hypothetical protein ACIQXU_20475 [Peribacillus sp. NPDC097284]|uniref:hypothetical protein n=1 Tax=Peribacillus sp. NPDC097284 TaxID=3364401 RepID=UPI00382B1013